MSARQDQDRFSKLRKPSAFQQSSKLGWILGQLASLLSTRDSLAFTAIITQSFGELFLWAESHETYISYDMIDKYISETAEGSDGVSTLGLLFQNMARVFILEAECINGAEHDFSSQAQRLFNNFALYAKLEGYDYNNLIDPAYDMLRDSRKKT